MQIVSLFMHIALHPNNWSCILFTSSPLILSFIRIPTVSRHLAVLFLFHFESVVLLLSIFAAHFHPEFVPLVSALHPATARHFPAISDYQIQGQFARVH